MPVGRLFLLAYAAMAQVGDQVLFPIISMRTRSPGFADHLKSPPLNGGFGTWTARSATLVEDPS